jgi:DNA topoisomerase-2
MENKIDLNDIYIKRSPLEHILLRPDCYIGSAETFEEKLWVFNQETKKLQYKLINYSPGLYKIFDEVLVNAADNYCSNLNIYFRRQFNDLYSSYNRSEK